MWHTEARKEVDQLAACDEMGFGELVQRVQSICEPTGDRWGQVGQGRIMVSLIPPFLVLLYVIRRDGQGLAGLFVHQIRDNPGHLLPTSIRGQLPPDAAFALARSRLSDMPDW
jgi:hypothetical protein